MNRPALLAAVSCIALFACDEKKEEAKAAPEKPNAPVVKVSPDKPAEAAPEKGAPPAAGKAGKGIDAPGNDAKVVAAAKKVLACKWADGSFDYDCEDYKAFTSDYDTFRDNKQDATLVNFLEDGDIKVRQLAYNRMTGWSGGAFADKAMAERMLVVAETTKEPLDMYYIGYLVGHIKVKETGLFDRIKALVTSTEKDMSLRGAIIGNLLPSNQDSEEAFTLTKEITKEKDVVFARSALNSFTFAGDSKKDQICDLYVEILGGAEEDLAASAAEKISYNHCTAKFDTLLKAVEGRVKGKKITVPSYAETLRAMCADKEVKPAQTKQAIALAHKILEDAKNPSDYTPYIRAAAVEASVVCDPKGGKKYITKFKADKQKSVSDKVTKLLAEK